MLTTIIKRIFLLTIITISSSAFADHLHSQQPPYGAYTISGVPTNNIQLTCTCNGNKFTVSPTQGSGVNVFNIDDNPDNIGLKMFNNNCPVSPDSFVPDPSPGYYAFRDATNCQLTSTDPRPIVYANVSITELGQHCMSQNVPAGSDCPAPWAMAAHFDVQPTSDNADYMVTNTAPDDKQPAGIPCSTWKCGGQSCCNQWVGQLFKTVPGSVTVTGGPADLQTVCAQATTNKLSTDPGLLIDLQTQHDLITSGHPETAVTLLCRLSSAGKDYGSLTLQNVNGIRVSTKTAPAHIWSTMVSVATQPSLAVNAKLGTPQFTPDSDVSDNYHNLWTVALQQAVYPGALTITGAPTTLTWSCTKGTQAYAVHSAAPGDLTLDFQQTHTQVSPSDPAAVVNAACDFKDSTGNDYGTITLTNLSDVNTSMQHPGSTIWAASNITTTQPAPVTGYKYTVPAPVAGGDSDPSGTYFNSWSVALYQGVYPGSVTITGAPTTLTYQCSSSVHVQGSHYDALGNLAIDFQTVHNQFSSDPAVILSPTCSFTGTDGLYYGSIAINSLNGTRPSSIHVGSTIWSAQVANKDNPSASTGYKFAGDPVSSGDSDKQTGTFFTSWTVTLVPS